jgi:hypothetical protein
MFRNHSPLRRVCKKNILKEDNFGSNLMRYVFLLTFALITDAFGVDAFLLRESGGYCIYDDGSTIKSLTCPNRLSIGSSKKVIGNGSLLSDDRDQWLLDFGKKQADAISSVYVPSLPSPQQIAAGQQRAADEAKQRAEQSVKNTAFADYVSATYGQEGEALRELIMSGVIDSTNYHLFVD